MPNFFGISEERLSRDADLRQHDTGSMLGLAESRHAEFISASPGKELREMLTCVSMTQVSVTQYRVATVYTKRAIFAKLCGEI